MEIKQLPSKIVFVIILKFFAVIVVIPGKKLFILNKIRQNKNKIRQKTFLPSAVFLIPVFVYSMPNYQLMVFCTYISVFVYCMLDSSWWYFCGYIFTVFYWMPSYQLMEFCGYILVFSYSMPDYQVMLLCCYISVCI